MNLFGLARLTQLVLPHMRKHNYGKIINNSSMGGKIYTPLGAWYHATKHALEGFSDCLRFEVQQFGIDVIVIEPGNIESEWSGIMLDQLQKTSGHTEYAAMANGFVKVFKGLKKSSPPEVIAQTVLTAITAKRPKTRYVSGASAGSYMFLRKILSDRLYDALFRKMLGA